jgi:hypothetical protein
MKIPVIRRYRMPFFVALAALHIRSAGDDRTPSCGWFIARAISSLSGRASRRVEILESAYEYRLRSSDHAAPGFWLSLLCGRGVGAVLISLGDFRVPGLSLRVGRDEGMFEGFD